MARILALLAYPLVLACGLAARLLGRDPLRLRKPGAGSLWIARPEPSRPAYFSEDSEVEGRNNGGFGGLPARVLVRLSRFWGRRPAQSAAMPARREGDIPDEIYTLW